MRSMLVVVTMLLAGCGSPAKVGEACTEDQFWGTSDCDEGLACIHPDDCKDECVGKCHLKCADASGCPAGCACQKSSPENGEGNVCMCGW